MATLISEVGARHNHSSLGPGVVSRHDRPFRFLLIDDDEMFGDLMVTVAKSRGIELFYYSSLESVGRIGEMGRFDAAILDFFLDRFTGLEIAEYIDAFFAKIPVILISAKDQNPGTGLPPKCIKSFVSKSAGPQKIFDSVLESVNKGDRIQSNDSLPLPEVEK